MHYSKDPKESCSTESIAETQHGIGAYQRRNMSLISAINTVILVTGSRYGSRYTRVELKEFTWHFQDL